MNPYRVRNIVTAYLSTGILTMCSFGEIPDNVIKLTSKKFGQVAHTQIWDVTHEYQKMGEKYRIYFSRSSISVPKNESDKVFVLVNIKNRKEIALSSNDFSNILDLYQEIINEPELLGDFCRLISSATLKNDEIVLSQQVASMVGGTQALREEKIGPPTINSGCILFYELNRSGHVSKVKVENDKGKVKVTKSFIDSVPEAKNGNPR